MKLDFLKHELREFKNEFLTDTEDARKTSSCQHELTQVKSVANTVNQKICIKRHATTINLYEKLKPFLSN